MLKNIEILLVLQAVFLGNRSDGLLVFRNSEKDEDYEKLSEMRGLIQELGESFKIARLTNNGYPQNFQLKNKFYVYQVPYN